MVKTCGTGASVHRGSIEDLASLRAGAAAADGVIHTAFNNISETTTSIADAIEANQHAVEALGEAPAGSGRPLAVTCGTALISPGRVVTEHDMPDSGSFNALAPAETAALSFAGRAVLVSVVRFPLTVHGEGGSSPYRSHAPDGRDSGSCALVFVDRPAGALVYSARSASAAGARAAQPAGASAPATAIARPASTSRTSSAGL